MFILNIFAATDFSSKVAVSELQEISETHILYYIIHWYFIQSDILRVKPNDRYFLTHFFCDTEKVLVK